LHVHRQTTTIGQATEQQLEIDRIAALSDKIVAGVARLAPGEAIVGRELAEDLGVQLGDRFTVALGRDTTDSMRAVGIYDAGVREVAAGELDHYAAHILGVR
jgi:ABC-type lipoprotein release transport system permease subunit